MKVVLATCPGCGARFNALRRGHIRRYCGPDCARASLRACRGPYAGSIAAIAISLLARHDRLTTVELARMINTGKLAGGRVVKPHRVSTALWDWVRAGYLAKGLDDHPLCAGCNAYWLTAAGVRAVGQWAGVQWASVSRQGEPAEWSIDVRVREMPR